MSSLKERLRKYLRRNYPNWVHKGHLTDLARENTNAIAENVGRRLRELSSAGIIEQRPDNKNKSTEYRYKQSEHEILSLQMQQKLYA